MTTASDQSSERQVRPHTSQTLDRGLRILRLLANSGVRGMTISEVATELSVGRPVVYRLVATLTEHDLVRRNEAGVLHLGTGLLGLAGAVAPNLREVALPVLRVLANKAGATAHLTIAEHDEAIAIAVVEPAWTDFHVGYRVGSRHPVDRGAAGRAIIGGRSGDGRSVASTGELQSGASGVAAPLLGLPGIEASVGVVSLGTLDEKRVGQLAIAAARDLARLINPTARPPAS